jgi:hypothetical protein
MDDDRVIDFNEALRARGRAPQPETRMLVLAVSLLTLGLALLMFGINGRLTSSLAGWLLSTQCRIEAKAEQLFPSDSGRRRVLPCELER